MITLTKLTKRKLKNGILYLNKTEFKEYTNLVFDPYIFKMLGIINGCWDEKKHKARKKKVLKEGKGLFFRGNPVIRKYKHEWRNEE